MHFVLQEDNEDSDDINFTCSNEFKLRECKLEVKDEAVESSSSRSAVSHSGSSLTTASISQTQDGLRNLPVFSQSKLIFFLSEYWHKYCIHYQ